VKDLTHPNSHEVYLTSMTGFGLARLYQDAITIEVSIKSVNHRGLDIKYHLPRELNISEAELNSPIARAVCRGRIVVDVSLTVDKEETIVALDEPAVCGFLAQIEKIRAQFPDVNLVIGLSDIMAVTKKYRKEVEHEKVIKQLIVAAVNQALLDLQQSRKKEGKALGEKILPMLLDSRNLMKRITKKSKEDVHLRYSALKSRVSEIFLDARVNEERLYQEVALLIERSDFKEEIDRLEAHQTYFLSLLAAQEPIGRKLDFLCQEMLRECTTLLSKAYDQTVIVDAIDLKAEVERLREQVQNIE
jgi:uncharacterized protein (TIGR00255 family)